MVFEVLLNHLAASLLRVRLPSFPPSPNVPSHPRRHCRWRRHDVYTGTEGKKIGETRKGANERRGRLAIEGGGKQHCTCTREYTFAQCESLMHRRVGTRTRSYPAVSRRLSSFRHGDERRLNYAYCYNERAIWQLALSFRTHALRACMQNSNVRKRIRVGKWRVNAARNIKLPNVSVNDRFLYTCLYFSDKDIHRRAKNSSPSLKISGYRSNVIIIFINFRHKMY